MNTDDEENQNILQSVHNSLSFLIPPKFQLLNLDVAEGDTFFFLATGDIQGGRNKFMIGNRVTIHTPFDN